MAESFQRARKLTEDDVRAIRSAHLSGVSQSELARRYGVTSSAINYRLSKTLDRPTDHQHCRTCTCHLGGI